MTLKVLLRSVRSQPDLLFEMDKFKVDQQDGPSYRGLLPHKMLVDVKASDSSGLQEFVFLPHSLSDEDVRGRGRVVQRTGGDIPQCGGNSEIYSPLPGQVYWLTDSINA